MTAPEARPLRVLTSFRQPTDTTNPYITQLYGALRRRPGLAVSTFSWQRALVRRWDVFHVHWPDTTFASPSRLRRFAKELLFAVFLVRLWLSRTAIVWTLHNTEAHEQGDPLARWLVRRLTAATTWFIRLNRHTPVPGQKPSTLIPHGHYVDWFAEFPQPDQVPGRFGCAGLIRPYKGIEDLISAFRALPGQSFSLAVGGRPADPQTAARIAALAAADDRVRLTLRFLAESELVELVCESQLTVFPYQSMHNSGAVLAALSLNRPVLVPRNEVNEDLRHEVGAGWVSLFEPPLTAESLAAARRAVGALAGKPDLGARGWVDAGAGHEEVYRQSHRWRQDPGHAKFSTES